MSGEDVSGAATEKTILALKKDDRFPHIGKSFGGVLLESGISADGGQGIVYKGKLDGKDVAVKILRDELVGDTNWRNRFIGDIEISKTISHPGVLEVLASSNEGTPYFVTQFMPFTLNKANLFPIEAANVLLKIARVLMHAHSKGIIHRDVKPSNVLLDESLEVKVCDWGIAKNVNSGSGGTLRRQIMGSPEYIAPEQCEDAGVVEAAADIYSWAATAHYVHSDTAPCEDRTTTMKRSKTTKNDTNTALVSRANVKKHYKVWLNDAIELKRAVLSDCGKERVVRLSDEYEDLIMMILNAKDPKYRPPLDMIVKKLEDLIATNKIVYEEPSDQETDDKLQAYAGLLENVERAKVEVEQLPPVDKTGLKNWLKPKLLLAKSLEQLANQTARADDKRSLYFTQAFELYSEIDLTIRTSPESVEGLGDIDKVISWLRCVTNHEQARKVYLGAKKAEKETRAAIDSASFALAEGKFEEAARNYKRIDASVSDLKEDADSLTQVMAKMAEELVSEGETVVSAEFALAALKHDDAFKLSEVLPESTESFVDLKKRVAALYVKISAAEIKTFETEYAAAKSAGDYVKMFQSAQDIEGRLKKIGKDAPEDAVKSFEAHKAELKDKDEDISTFIKIYDGVCGNLVDDVVGLEHEYDKDVKSQGVLKADQLASYKEKFEYRLGKLGSMKQANIGPRYESLFSKLSALKDDVEFKDKVRVVSQGDDFYMRAKLALEFASNYAGKDPGKEKIFKHLLFKAVDEEKTKGDTRTL